MEGLKTVSGWDPTFWLCQAQAEMLLAPRQGAGGPTRGVETLWQRGPGPQGWHVELLWAPLPLPSWLPEVLFNQHERVPGHSQGQ